MNTCFLHSHFSSSQGGGDFAVLLFFLVLYLSHRTVILDFLRYCLIMDYLERVVKGIDLSIVALARKRC